MADTIQEPVLVEPTKELILPQSPNTYEFIFSNIFCCGYIPCKCIMDTLNAIGSCCTVCCQCCGDFCD